MTVAPWKGAGGGEPRKLSTRSEVAQAQRFHPELNVGDTGAERAWLEGEQPNPTRPKWADR